MKAVARFAFDVVVLLVFAVLLVVFGRDLLRATNGVDASHRTIR